MTPPDERTNIESEIPSELPLSITNCPDPKNCNFGQQSPPTTCFEPDTEFLD